MAQQHYLDHYQQPDTPEQTSGFSLSDIDARELPPMLGTGALVLYGLSRRSLGGLFLAGIGGGLLYRQIQNKMTAKKLAKSGKLLEFEDSIIVQQPIEDVFAFWSDLQNLPRFMDHIKSIHKLDDIRSHWQAFIPFTEQVIEWDVEITEFRTNETISWQSAPASDIHTEATIRFQRISNGNDRTRIHVTLSYRPSTDFINPIARQFLSNIPTDTIKTDLERFQRLVENNFADAGVIDNDISF